MINVLNERVIMYLKIENKDAFMKTAGVEFQKKKACSEAILNTYAKELYDHFSKRFGVSCCKIITENQEFMSPAYMESASIWRRIQPEFRWMSMKNL